MNIPAFSIFSSISELFVTFAVLYTVISNLRGRPLKWKLLGCVLLFEVCVNVMYMVNRAPHAETSGTLRALFAIHGILSLFMLVSLLLIYMIATFDYKAGHPTWFQRHRVGSWVFVTLWLVAVGSGEIAFVWRYFPFT